MASNDQIVLDQVLKQRQAEIAPTATASEFFELFSAEQIVKDYDLSYDEIESGLVGGGRDGGIDGIYLFVNGDLVQEDPDYVHLKKNITLDLFIIQAKMGEGFQETPVERFITASDDIFDLSKDINKLASVYNPSLVEAIKRFRDTHQQLAAKFPTFRVSYFYTCKGADPDKNVMRKVNKLKAVLTSFFASAEFKFNFLGASKLLELARRTPQTSYTLALAENPVSSGGQVDFVCLVKIRDFFKFITDEKGTLQKQIFEANVRDYQGRTEVNDEIQKSLLENNPEDFWWLNNGVSILASQASLSGKALTIEDPQIVNGLQTSTEIFNYCEKSNTEDDHRKILVRVIVPADSASRDRIIKATNSQTVVQQASLRATDKIHRDIEEFLRPKGLFYDRRKNYYKNEGKPRDKIVGIPHLAQAVMAIVLGRPDTARARPSSLLKKDEDYEKIFSSRYPIQIYHVCAEGMRVVEAYLKSSVSGLAAKDRNNLRYYIAMHAVQLLAGNFTSSPAELAKLDITQLNDPRIRSSLNIVKQKYDSLGGTDKVAKSAELLNLLKEKCS